MLSFEEIQSKINQAVYPLTARPEPVPYEDFYVVAVYPDEAIIRLYTSGESKETFFKVTYTVDGETVTLAPREQWQEVEREWVAKSVVKGNALKAISKDDDWLWVGNHIVMFGERDLSNVLKYDPHKKSFSVNPNGRGEYFTKHTMLDSPYTATGFLHEDIEHGFGKVLDGPDAPGEDDVVGYVDWKSAKATAQGVWVKQALNRRNQYIQAIEPFIELGMIGTSSEAVPELVEITKNGEIKKWGLKRNTLSFMPADPRMMGENAVTALKSLAERYPGLKAVLPQDAGDASGESETPDTETPTPKHFANPKETKMSENTPQDPNARLDKMETLLENFSKSLTTITKALEDMPALNRMGYKTDDGGTADPTHKSFGDFLLAVKRNDEKRLKSVYGSYKDISGETGESGGWLAPAEMAEPVLNISVEADPVMSRVNVIPVSRPSGNWPSLDKFFAPTAGSGQVAEAGGVKATKTAAGATLTETEPGFTDLTWRLNKVGGYTEVENEISSDAPAIEALLRTLFGVAIGAKNHRNVLRGSGVGEPLGILNAACAIGVSPATNNIFSYADSLSMLAVFKRALSTPIWLHHPGIISDVGVMEIGTNGAAAIFGMQGGLSGRQTLHTYELHPSEHLPQANNAGAVMLADLKMYNFWMNKAGLSIAFSEHAAFKEDKGTWRFTQRNDGQPALKNKITLDDPQGSYYISPFVYHND